MDPETFRLSPPPLGSSLDPPNGYANKGPVYPNWYRVLDITPSPHLTDQDIKAAYLAQTAVCIPTRFPPGSEERSRAEVYLRVIRHAYEVLRNEKSRMRYELLRERVAAQKDMDRNQALIDRSRRMAEGWLKRIEAETIKEEEHSSALLAKKRLDDFFRTDAQLRKQHPSLPRLTREQVQRFFQAESTRRKAQRDHDHVTHRMALEHMIIAEFQRRAQGMPDEERKVRWKKARDMYMQMSKQRKKEDAEHGQRDWEVARDAFFSDLMKTHQHDHLCLSSTTHKNKT